MRALISGQAGTAVMIDGGKINSIHIDETDRAVQREEWEVDILFRGMTDTAQFDDLSQEDVVEKLVFAWRKDRSLPLLLILIDKDEEPETRHMAAEALSEFFSEEIKKHTSNIFYAEPLPRGADLPGAIDYSKSVGNASLVEFLELLKANQANIILWKEAWNSLPLDLFDSPDNKSEFRLLAIRAGGFHEFVTRRGAVDGVLVDLLLRQEFRGKVRARTVFQELASPFKRKADMPPLISEEEDDNAAEIKRSATSRQKQKPVHKTYKNVEKQIEAIGDLMTSGKTDKALQWLGDLIESQRARSEPEHISKTLCNLAQHAKAIGNIRLQLDLSKWAVEVMPTDGWAYAQVGDAYRALGEPNKALEEYSRAASFGKESLAMNGKAALHKDAGELYLALKTYEETIERFPDNVVARNSRAEVLKQQGKLPEALRAYEETIERFSNDVFARTGRAEVLKEQGKLPEALRAYEETIERFSNDVFAWTGRAEVLKEQGKLPEALRAYEETIARFPDNVVARNGRAEVLKEQDKLPEALQAYETTIERFSYDVFAWTGRAEVLKEQGKLPEALQAYETTIERFSYDVVARNGRAEVLKEQGKLPEALRAYEETIERFSNDVVARSGRAEVLKEQGKLPEALRAYEETIAHFPDNVVARNGRAEILRAQGSFHEALDVYNNTIDQFPYDPVTKNGKASVLVSMGRLEQALKVLPEGHPTTIEQWIAYHMRGMAFLKSGKIDEAVEIFRYGVEMTPFALNRPYFQTALAMVMIIRKEYRKALDSLPTHMPASIRSAAKVLEIHAFGELGECEKAQSAYEDVRKSKIIAIVEPRDELAGRFVFDDSGFVRKPDQWLFERECEMLLAA